MDKVKLAPPTIGIYREDVYKTMRGDNEQNPYNTQKIYDDAD